MKKILTTLVVAGGLMAACLTPAMAQSRSQAFTNCSNLMMAANTSSNINAQVLLQKGRGLAILPKLAGTNAGTAALVLSFQVSANGTDWSAPAWLAQSVTMNGTTAVIGYTNFPPDALDNVKWLRLASITNGHNASVWVSNVTWSVFP